MKTVIESTQCGRCGRPLKDAKSRDRGYGPVCYKKMQEVDENQMTADEVEEETECLNG